MAENEKKELNVGETAGLPKKKKQPGKKKPNVFARAWQGLRRWCREMRSELKKVQWPTAKETTNNTLTVIACVFVVGVFIWAFDWLAAGAAKALITLVQG